MSPTPQVVAHRGASDVVAEHTLGAYLRAIDDGADALECDVRLTADGHLVCVHDRRVDRTSDGRGPVSTLELADLAELDFASWHAARTDPDAPDVTALGSDVGPDGKPVRPDAVLTLERLLELVVDCRLAGRDVRVAVETKHPTRYAGLVERRLVALLDRFGLIGTRRPDDAALAPVRVMSFSSLSLRRIRAMAPALPTVMLTERVLPWSRDGSLPTYVDVAGPSIDVVRAFPEYVERVRRAGRPTHVWTVDDTDDVELCLELGVDAIITNRPAAVVAHRDARRSLG